MQGIVKTYNITKGYGFIYCNDDTVFFHKSQIDKWAEIEIGAEVEFTLIDTPKGKQAQNIKLIKNSIQKKFIKIGDTRIKISNIKNYGISDDENELLLKIQDLKKVISNLQNKISNLDFKIKSDEEWESHMESQRAYINAFRAQVDKQMASVNEKFGVYSDLKIEPASSKSTKNDFKLNYLKNEKASCINEMKSHINEMERLQNLLNEKKYNNYLYITTYQNDNFVFYQQELDCDIYDIIKQLDDSFL